MNDVALTSNQLALGRNVMALERTLMAMLRTSVSLISFGFTIAKFLQPLQEKGTVGLREHAPRNMGLFLIGLGMGLLILGVLQYFRVRKVMVAGDKRRIPVSLAVVSSVGVILLGLYTLIDLLFGVGVF